jgi:8-oxo-dGTP diphosphatase
VTLVRAAVLISAPIEAVYEHALARARRPLPWLGPTRLARADPPRRFELAGGRVHRACWLIETGAGTLLTDEVSWRPPFGPAGWLLDTLFLRRRLLTHLVGNAAYLRTSTLDARTSTVDDSPSGVDGLVVVGAALYDEAGRVLAAQRSRPPALAGQWEFPGGKVEPGERETQALIRECREELGVEIELAARVGDDLPVQGGGGVLRVWHGRITAGLPEPREHQALRWLAPDELDEVPWLPADRPLITLLRQGPPSEGPPR